MITFQILFANENWRFRIGLRLSHSAEVFERSIRICDYEAYPPTPSELGAYFDRFVEVDYGVYAQGQAFPISLDEFKRARAAIREEWIARLSSGAFTASEPNYIQQGMSEIDGIVCMSEVPDDLLMWGHYTDSHRGFVAEFESRGRPRYR